MNIYYYNMDDNIYRLPSKLFFTNNDKDRTNLMQNKHFKYQIILVKLKDKNTYFLRTNYVIPLLMVSNAMRGL